MLADDPARTAHPDLVTLERFASGELSGSTRETLERHIHSCFECQDAVEALRPGPPVDTPVAGHHTTRDDTTRYRILSTLGEGGSSDVFLARDMTLSRDVALKLFRDAPPDLDEATALARLRHPNVVTVFDAVNIDGRPGLAMELVLGGTLATHSFRSPREVFVAFRAIARGLSAAHSLGVVHGDLKPDNVLWHADEETPKIADFGLGRIDGHLGRRPSNETSFAPPELATGASPTPRSDQYSLAAMWVAALSPSRPDLATLDHVPSGLRPHLARALSPNPRDRFPSVEALISAIERRIRRRRLAFVGAVLTALTLALVLTWTREVAARSTCVRSFKSLAPTWPAAAPETSRVAPSAARFASWTQRYAAVATEACQTPARIDPLLDRCLRVEAARLQSLLRDLVETPTRDGQRLDQTLTAIDAADPHACESPAKLATMADARGRPLPLELLLAAYAEPAIVKHSDEVKVLATIGALERLGPSAALTQAFIDLEFLRQSRRDFEGAADANERALQTALALGDLGLLRFTLFTEAEHALFRLNDLPRARASMARVDAIRLDPTGLDRQREHRLRASLAFVAGDIEAMAREALVGLLVNVGRGNDAYLPAKDLMLAFFELGHHELSLALCHWLLEHRIARSGREHRRTAGILRYIGLNLLHLGRPEEARAAIDEALRIRHRLLGSDHHETAFVELALAELRALEGDLASASALAESALETLARDLPAGHFDLRRQALRVASFLAPLDPCTALSLLPPAAAIDGPRTEPYGDHDRWSTRIDDLRMHLSEVTRFVSCDPPGTAELSAEQRPGD